MTGTCKCGRSKTGGSYRCECGRTIYDSRKQSLCIDDGTIELLQAEADRLDRSLSWIVQRCVAKNIGRIRALPGVDEPMLKPLAKCQPPEAAE